MDRYLLSPNFLSHMLLASIEPLLIVHLGAVKMAAFSTLKELCLRLQEASSDSGGTSSHASASPLAQEVTSVHKIFLCY